MRAIAAGASDVGLQREHNEDSYVVLKEYDLFVVADGMGGHRAGDVASKLATETISEFFFQITYSEQEVAEDAGYLHACWRRSTTTRDNPEHIIAEGITGRGHYAGTYLVWNQLASMWWGEGEVKFFIDGDPHDGDDAAPTICGTGTEDYFCGSYNFDVGTLDKKAPRAYVEFTTPYAGLPQVIRPDGCYNSQTRFGLYRWHIMDPVQFQKKLRVTMQALGWQAEGRFRPLQDDIASVAYWYQTLPTAPFPQLPDRDYLDVG